ncbi:exodeoxyribonuclease V subunit gamma [Nocardia mangyaensis]|uniref:exodeoxyribonuclease V subunit gamma n=1 Tax=Nocardia mangyaensis TaxID=2213200 RepID=UPI00267642C7|nr:exodeoxyribonuclease V subunit gamma [Nocardia mangyaensis]MDO3648442.1 exodeoxyribonuclease V subunit gamma [Nocardia mangyaensis]
MPLHLHRAERADALADGLGSLLGVAPADPFATEVVAVPAKGVERWLAQRLSGVLGVAGTGDGIAANIAFPAPSALVAEVLAAAGGVAPADDPWGGQRLVWTLLGVIDEVADQPWAAVLARHLGLPGTSHRIGRRYATAAHLAALFDSYAAQRPRLLLDWAADSETDGAGGRVPDDLAWQPQLWRALRAAIGAPSPAERLADACARLRAAPDSIDLPARVSLFGLTRLPADQLAVLTALSAHRDVHLWLAHPSPTMWTALAEPVSQRSDGPDPGGLLVGRTGAASRGVSVDHSHSGGAAASGAVGADVSEAAAAAEVGGAVQGGVVSAGGRAAVPSAPGQARLTGLRPRADDHSADLVTHPLLSGLARDVRELEQRLNPLLDSDIHLRTAIDDATLLGAVQTAIRDDRTPGAGAVADGSVEVHACHGPARQVEVLRDLLLRTFADDPGLQPRDVLIMCPDVEAFAPLVRAAFGQRGAGAVDVPVEGEHPAHQLRVRLADRGRAVTNPMLAVVIELLELADGRVTVTQVLDLAAGDTVRRRCGFDDDDIERLREWAAESGARWGIGQRQREAFGLVDFAQNTLNAAVDRILLGVTADESGDDWLDLALPLDDVDSNDVDLAGRFAEFVDRLAVCLRDLRGPRPAAEWTTVLLRAVDLLTDVPVAHAWIRAEARREIVAATEHAGDTPLRLADVAVLLTSRLAGGPGRANFRTGELTVCTLVPMRSVPHRVVVLLGLDDDVFPRPGTVDGDDLLARDPLVGERDARSEDRQLLLDAIMAAGDKLLVLHTGADPVTGATRPPAVPVAELLDVLAAHVGPVAMPGVHIRHPLQAFDRRNFAPDRPRSFDTVALAGARAAARPAHPRPPLLTAPLPPAPAADVALAELISFAEHPVRAFLWQRLGLRVPEESEDIADQLPIELDGLAKWDLGERMLTARLTGADPAGLRAAEWRRGTLPPFAFGAAVLDEVEGTVDTLVRTALPDYEAEPRAVDIALDLGNGRTLAGTVPEVRGETLVRTTYSRLAPKHRLAAWVSLLALAATEDRSWRAISTGRGQFRSRPVTRSVLVAPEAPAALTVLRDLVRLRDEGMCEPLPVAPAATAAYAERRFRGDSVADALLAAEHAFDGGPNGPDKFGDHTDRYLRYVWGRAPRFERFAADPARQGEPESTRFGAVARRWWAPLLAAESQGQP